MSNQIAQPSFSRRQRSHPRGSVLVYTTGGLVALCAIASLAVDYGRVQLVKTELQAAADLAARYAASGVKHELNGTSAAVAMANVALTENKANAKLIKGSQATVQLGSWNPSSKKFTATTDRSVANAVRVTVSCQSSDQSAVPLSFASVIGFAEKELTATAIALWDSDVNLSNSSSGTSSTDMSFEQKYVPATSNMWLSGMPAGTVASQNNPHNNPDYAGNTTTPKQSPVDMANLRVTPGSTMRFDGVNGGANNLSSSVLFDGDGNPSQVVQNLTGAEHAKSNINAPINSVIAVFLSDSIPSGTPPTNLDFSTAASRDFQTLKPALRQVFFIGDGRPANGDLQQFVVPPGATRLFIGTMDSYEWNNNIGGFSVTASASTKVVIVK